MPFARHLTVRTSEVVIPGRSNRPVKIEHNRALYRQRNRIERMFGFNGNRAIAAQYVNASTFLGMVCLTTIRD